MTATHSCVCDSGLGTVPHVPLYERERFCAPTPQPMHVLQAVHGLAVYGAAVTV